KTIPSGMTAPSTYTIPSVSTAPLPTSWPAPCRIMFATSDVAVKSPVPSRWLLVPSAPVSDLTPLVSTLPVLSWPSVTLPRPPLASYATSIVAMVLPTQSSSGSQMGWNFLKSSEPENTWRPPRKTARLQPNVEPLIVVYGDGND